MDENKITEEDVRSFCLSKGMKNVPEFVADFSEKLKERLVDAFDKIIANSLK
jgi:hypothetical protein